jgi:hypothetical protein
MEKAVMSYLLVHVPLKPIDAANCLFPLPIDFDRRERTMTARLSHSLQRPPFVYFACQFVRRQPSLQEAAKAADWVRMLRNRPG